MKATHVTPIKPDAPREAERRARKMRKRRDAAGILTVLGVVLFTSPLISAIGSAEGGGAVPLAVQYVFDVWAILIGAAFIMARVLPGSDDVSLTEPASQTSSATIHQTE